MKALFRFAMAALLAVPLVALAATPPTNWTAQVFESDGMLRSYGFPAKSIEVTFPKAFPTNLVQSPSSYALFKSDTPTATIPIQGVALGGNLHGGTKEKVSRAILLPAVELPAPGPKSKYMVRIEFGNESSGEIIASWPDAGAEPEPAPPPSNSELFNLFTLSSNLFLGPLHISVDARSPFEGGHVPALDFELKYDVLSRPLRAVDDDNFNRMWIVSGHLAAEGTYKLNDHDTNIADNISLSANLDLLYLYRLPNPLTRLDPRTRQREGKLAYFAGFRLKGFELESDQQFDVINWSVQPQLALWVPYSNLPGLWWSRNLGIHGNAATPLFLYAGYSLVDSFRTDPSKVSPAIQKDDRLEVELAYAFPITSRLRFGLRSRFFWLLGESVQRNYQEIFARYYLNDTGTTALLLKYTHGAVPPKFEKGESVGAGLSIEF